MAESRTLYCCLACNTFRQWGNGAPEDTTKLPTLFCNSCQQSRLHKYRGTTLEPVLDGESAKSPADPSCLVGRDVSAQWYRELEERARQATGKAPLPKRQEEMKKRNAHLSGSQGSTYTH